MFDPCSLYHAAEYGFHHFEVMNIREFPLHVEEHHELVTTPAKVVVQDLIESTDYPGVILGVEQRHGPDIQAYELQQYFPNKPQIGEVYEAVMTRPFLNQKRKDGKENRSRYCIIEYKRVGKWEKDNNGNWQLRSIH